MRTLLTPPDLRETCTFDFEVLTPIHIGGRVGVLKPTEFLWDGGKVYLLDEDRFAVWLKERNLIDAFVQEAKTGRLNLRTFFQKPFCKGWKEALPRLTRLSIPGGMEGLREFRPMIRDAAGQVFLPGTAIKGVLRTAVLYAWLKQQETRQRRADEKALAFDGKKKMFFSAEWLQKAALQSASLSGAKSGPNTDVLRCLMVRDAYPVLPVETRVIRLQFLSKRGTGEFYWSSQKDSNGRPKDGKLEIWVEAVTAGRFRVELCWDRQLWKAFTASQQAELPVKGLDDLLSLLCDFSSDVTQFESEHYHSSTGEGASTAMTLQQWYRNLTGTPMRIGFGSGMLSTTIGLQLSPAARQHIRDRCAPRNGERPGDPAPKSRRVWVKPDGSALPLGWGRLEEPQGEPVPSLRGASNNNASSSKVTRTSPEQTSSVDQPATVPKPESLHQSHEETWANVTLTYQKGGGGVVTVIGAAGKAEARGDQAQTVLNSLSPEQVKRLEKKGSLTNLTVVVVIEGNMRTVKAVVQEASTN